MAKNCNPLDTPLDPRGRPRIEEELQRRRNVSLSDRRVELARRIGEGNISKGIREALDYYRDAS